jgi:flavin-dependent dehydrogenase
LPDLLEHFLDILRGSRKLEEIQIVSKTGGLIPCESDQRRLFKNVLLVGDAAGHAHPITGAGIFNAVVAGLIAGRIAAKAVETEDLRYLAQYEIECQEAFGESLSYGTLKRKFLEENWNRPEVDFEELIRKTWVGFKEYYQDRRKIPLPSPLPSRKCAS